MTHVLIDSLLGKNKIVQLNIFSTELGYLSVLTLRRFKQWGIKTESEKKQGIRKGEQIDNKMEEELLPMECTERQGNKTVKVIEETPCACVSTLRKLLHMWTTVTCKQDYASYS